MVRLALLLSLCLALAACQVIRSVNVLTTDDELALGAEFDRQITEEAQMYGDADIAAYVQELTDELAAVCQRPDVEYRSKVVASDEINAFAVPGGYLYVNVGLIRAAESESELAGVMGHEIGHVVARHGAKHLTQQLGLAALVGLVHGQDQDPSKLQEVVGAAVAVGGQGLMLNYSREDELEADALGVGNLHDAGVDPRGLASFFGKLLEQAGGPEPGLLRLLSTHPPTDERIRRVTEQIAALPRTDTPRRDSADFRRVRASLPPPEEGP